MVRGGFSPKPVGNEGFNKKSYKTIARILKLITETYKYRFIFVLFLILLSSVAGVAGAIFLEILIDNFIIQLTEAENPVFTGLFYALIVMSVIYLVGVVSTFIFNRIMVTISQGVQKTIRDGLFSHMQKLPVRYFDTNPHGDLMSRFTNDIDALRHLLGQSVPVVFATLISLLLTFIAMIYMSFILTVIVIFMIILNLIITAIFGKKSAKFYLEQQKNVGEINAHVEEIIGNQKVIKIFNYEDQTKRSFNELNEKFEYSSAKAGTYAGMLVPLMINLSSLQYVVIAIIGGFLAISGFGSLTLGTIAAFLQLSRAFSMPLGHLSMQINSIVMALAGATRVFEVMEEEPEKDLGHVTLVKTEESTWVWKNKETYTPLKGDVQLNDVSFGYEENYVLNNIDFYAHPGEKVAIVGATGAGKTTITNLLNRFYDIQKGHILYDGIDISQIQKPHLRHSLGMVLQDTNLFTDTIRENIRYGNLEATDEEVYEAARLANAHNFIEILPNGYDSVLTDAGAELSQGQRQLLSIARAAVANPPVMILDEATSSIDTRTELIVQKGMDSLMEGRTVFVIAHRLSTVKNSNAIVVMDLGQIVEKGNHKSLLEKKGRYYGMYAGPEV